MPHQCTNCGETFPDGSKEMLSGCPECGGNKFQFRPSSSLPSTSPEAASSPARDADAAPDAPAATRAPDSTETTDETEPSDSAASTPAGNTADRASATDSETGVSSTDAESTDTESTDAGEDSAQASARRDVVDPNELAGAVEREARTRPPKGAGGRVIEPASDDRPGLDDLREELNDQFESIKIVNPGQYELNLMELYDRDEYIISLQEDGRYVIEVPDTWGEARDSDE